MLLGAWGLIAIHARAADAKRIGFLSLSADEFEGDYGRAFRARLRELGHVEGTTLLIEHRSAADDERRLERLAHDLVAMQPDVVVSGLGTLPALTLKRVAPSTLPVVFSAVADPVGAGLVTRLSRHGGNVTGIATQVPAIAAKRMEILKELLPDARRIAVLMNPATPATVLSLAEMRSHAEGLGISIRAYEFRTRTALADVLASIRVDEHEALVVLEDPLANALQADIARWATTARIPSVFGGHESVRAGGLFSFGPSRIAAFERAADYVDRILRGARPQDLPVEQATKFDLALNMAVARRLSIVVPPSMMMRVTEVVGP